MMEATTGYIPSAVLDVYRILHAAAHNIIVVRREQHGPMLVSVRVSGQIKASLLDELPQEKWRDTLHEVATERGVVLACLIAEANVRKLPPLEGPPGGEQSAVIFNFMEGAHHQEYMAICEIDQARSALAVGRVDPVIRDR
jgi:hypothetical protein